MTKTTKQVAPNEESKQETKRYRGPWSKLTADALHSPNFKGRVDLGTYTKPEADKGVLARRIEAVRAEGYRSIEVREIPAEIE